VCALYITSSEVYGSSSPADDADMDGADAGRIITGDGEPNRGGEEAEPVGLRVFGGR